MVSLGSFHDQLEAGALRQIRADIAQLGEVARRKALRRQAELLAKTRVYFAFDSSAIDDESRAIIEAHASYLAANPGIRLTLEGHCDERGTREYNLALGQRRANAARDVLVANGVSGARVSTISYGKDRPTALGSSEDAWAQNRRAVTVVR